MDNPGTIPLFCWILDVSDRSFSVSIEETRTVDNLKEEILTKKSATFANIEADQLRLWKVSSTFSFGHTMLITLPQDLHPDWHHSDPQE
jgi:Crinkler effector protein N-terminal domain